jgi:DNA primase
VKEMPWFPEEWIDEVVSRNDIVDVVSDYVVLKPSGRGYFGLCPFHNEKTASFHVSPERQIYHCFGCGEGGNVVSFIMAIERMEFVEAMKHLADRSNMPLPDDSSTDTAEYQRKKDQKQQLYDMNKECARYYHQVLFGDEGKDALAYLTSRGFDIRLIRSFGLGYAPNRWEGARQYLKAKGYDDEQMLQAGITVENKDKGSIYDRFRNRVIFPIINTRGLVLGFGGRVMDDSLPKYLNSSDGPTFNKSLNLFGLNLAAKVRPLEYLIITEGYMDVMSLHQFGFPQAVASLGTSLTPEQARLMRRYAADVYIAYDGDEAGQKATLRALDILKEAGCRARVIQFPDKMDPDEVLKQFGPEYFKKLMDRSLSHVDYKFERLREQHDLTTMDGKVNFATDASEVLAKIDNPIERDAHVQELESLLGIKSRAIYDQINRIQAAGMKQKRVQRNIVGNNRNANDKRRVRILQSSHIKAEAHLINLMVQGADMARKIINGLGDLTLQDPLHRQVVDIVRSLLERGRDVSEAQILSHLQDRDQVKKLVDIFHQEMEYDNIDNFISDCLNQVEKNALEKHRQELQNEITVMDQEGIPDPEKYKELLKELQQLNYRLRADLLERRELREKRRV